MYLQLALFVAIFIILLFWKKPGSLFKLRQRQPVSVNYHFTRKCNYSCGFCFHTATTSHIEPLERAKAGLFLLKEAGMRKINFAGGEPFLYPKFLGNLLEYCKKDLCLESVSIVTNGSRVRDSFLSTFGQYIDVLAVSCDSFQEEINAKIGRGSGAHLPNVLRLSRLCREHGIKFKLNTVVNKFNYQEDMNRQISEIQPFRWKCFQVLIIKDENDSDKTLRNANSYIITDEEFKLFCNAHSHHQCLVPEPNNVMKSSYLILDEYMRFLNKGTGTPTESILDIGVQKALEKVYWDEGSFHARGGIYDWSKTDKGCSAAGDPNMDW